MNLLNPLNLLWAIPLLGGIVALWMLRLKRQDVTVSSLYLWSTLLQETQANAPFQKLRRNLLLFLQLLTAFLLIGAFARPFVYGQTRAGHTIVLVLDTSASMNSTDVSGGRLAAAKAAGPPAFEPPGAYRSRMRAQTEWMKKSGIYPDK